MVFFKQLEVVVPVFILMFFFCFKEAQAQKTSEQQRAIRNTYVEQAMQQFEGNDWNGAKKTIDKGLEKSPKDADLRMLDGKYYFHEQNYDKARYALKKALEFDPNHVDAKQVLVNVEQASKRYSSAICYVNELLEVNPYWRGLWQKKIELYELQGNTIEANHLRKRISQIYPEDKTLQKDYIYHTEVTANKNQKEGRIDDAIALNRALVQQQPDNVNHYLSLINDYEKAGDQYNALAYADRGLKRFPGNMALINKKSGILSEQKNYNLLLGFLQEQIQRYPSATLRNQYNYYLLEAARNAKGKEPAALHGAILAQSPGNEEAFNYVFNDLIAKQQYEEALHILSRHRTARGSSKNIALKELMVYQRMGNTSRATALTKQLFLQYPDDKDLQAAYAKVMLDEAKAKMNDNLYAEALPYLEQVRQYGDAAMSQVAQNYIYNANLELGYYNQALNILSNEILAHPDDPNLYLKRAAIYQKQERYHMAISSYDKALELVTEDQKQRYLEGYEEMLVKIVKEQMEAYQYDNAMTYVRQWLQQDPNNYQALRYAYNLSYLTKDKEGMMAYAQRGDDAYPDDVFFKVKLIELKRLKQNEEEYGKTYELVHRELLKTPYNQDMINAFVLVSDDYSQWLIKKSRSDSALVILDTALHYAPESKDLKYTKGLAYGKLRQYDSAYYYQSFYEPSPMELDDYKQRLYYLKYRGYHNHVGLYHLRSRFGDDYAISTISTLEYSHETPKNTYTGRVNYAGRQEGKGFQVQGEWARIWDERTWTNMNIALANQFFPSLTLNASVFRTTTILSDLEAEIGIGYRELSTNEGLLNLVLGATKEVEPWWFNVRFNNFLLDNNLWLYNLSLQARYYLSSPKNYIMAVSSVGSSPDVDMIDYHFYNGFSVLNTMVGAGAGHMLTNTVSLDLLGTWYNYQLNSTNYSNLYSIYIRLNVAF